MKLTEEQVISKMNDFYQKLQYIDPSKAVPGFPLSPEGDETLSKVISEVNSSQEEEEVKVAVPAAQTAQELARKAR